MPISPSISNKYRDQKDLDTFKGLHLHFYFTWTKSLQLEIYPHNDSISKGQTKNRRDLRLFQNGLREGLDLISWFKHVSYVSWYLPRFHAPNETEASHACRPFTLISCRSKRMLADCANLFMCISVQLLSGRYFRWNCHSSVVWWWEAPKILWCIFLFFRCSNLFSDRSFMFGSSSPEQMNFTLGSPIGLQCFCKVHSVCSVRKWQKTHPKDCGGWSLGSNISAETEKESFSGFPCIWSATIFQTVFLFATGFPAPNPTRSEAKCPVRNKMPFACHPFPVNSHHSKQMFANYLRKHHFSTWCLTNVWTGCWRAAEFETLTSLPQDFAVTF